MKEIDLNRIQDVEVHKKNKKTFKKVKNHFIKQLIIITCVSIILSIAYLFVFQNKNLHYVFSHLVIKQAPNYLVDQPIVNVYINESFPAEIRDTITTWIDKVEVNNDKRFEIQTEYEKSDLIISLSKNDTESPLANLLLVGHFYWIKENINLDEFNNTVYVLENDRLAIAGASSYGYETNVVTSPELLLNLEKDEDTPALISPDFLNFQYKLLSINDKYYLDELKSGESNKENGSITLSIEIINQKNIPEFLENSLTTNISYALNQIPKENSKKVFTINQTGVTAITRRLTTSVVNSADGAYPAKNIGEFLSDADLTHVSNEISFVDNCTNGGGMSFCSRTEAIDSLKLSGVDIVELTGNHNNDYGSNANTSSIEIYKELGWDYFGGGLDLADAQEILYKELPSGEIVAFIGYNYWNAHFGFTGALATEKQSGANPYNQDQMKSDIIKAKGNADFVIVDLQFSECYSYPEGYVIYPICYKSTTVANQQDTFRMAIDFGADMVVGTQAHQPQTYEIYNEKPIFYGLGNLYFDQAMWPGTRHGIVLTHYFLNGKYVQTKLTTTNYKEDLITYVSAGEERKLLLELLQQAR